MFYRHSVFPFPLDNMAGPTLLGKISDETGKILFLYFLFSLKKIKNKCFFCDIKICYHMEAFAARRNTDKYCGKKAKNFFSSHAMLLLLTLEKGEIFIKNRDCEKIFRRLEYLWHNEILDRCCISVTAPKDPLHPYREEKPSTQQELQRWYTDGEWILKRNLEAIEKTYYAGDALPCIFPYFGTGGHAKYVCPEEKVEYSKDTIWVHPSIEDLDACTLDFDPASNKVFQQERNILSYLAAESKGRYFMGMPDNCGSYDALAQLRGNEELMIDFLTQPESVKRAGKRLVEILKISSEELFQVLKENCRGGSIHAWMNTWSPGRHMQLQCDLSVMISSEAFREFILDELISTSTWLDHAIYHMDGIEQIRHLDDILQISSIHMIQWVQVDGQPDAVASLPTLKKIQAAGKGLVICIGKNQVQPLLENLSPKGLNLLVGGAKDPDEADRIVKLAESYT